MGLQPDDLLTLASLSNEGLSAPEIALAITIGVPGQCYGELAAKVRKEVERIKNRMNYRHLFASRKRGRPATKRFPRASASPAR